MRATYFALALCFVMHHACGADDSLKSITEKATIDMPITTAPATFLLGASGEQVPRLSSFRTFATQVARAYDENGKIANAVAAEVAPSLAIGRTSWDDIVNSQFTRILSRTTVSFATKVGNNNSGNQTALGVQSILYSREMDSVILMAATSACRSAANAISQLPPPLAPQPNQSPTLPKEVLEKIQQCQTKIDGLLTKWNQTMLAIGAGKVFSSSNDTKPSDPDSSSVWITGSYGRDLESEEIPSQLRKGYLITGHYRVQSNVRSSDPINKDVLARQRIAGINLRYGNGKWAGVAEYSRISSKGQGIKLADHNRSILGMEYQVTKDAYLTLGVSNDNYNSQSKRSLIANLNWGISKDSSIFPSTK